MAIGFSLVYGIARIPNFAHGSLYILAGLMTWLFSKSLGIIYPVSFILSLLIVIAVSVIMYRLILIRLRGMVISEILVTYAFGFAILEGLRCTGFVGHRFSLSPFFKGTLFIGDVPIDFQRVIILGASVLLMLALWLFTHRTKLGLALRAIAQDESAALSLGINSDMAAAAALALNAVLLGFAASLILPLGNIRAETGYDVLIYGLAVCIVGGLGSWWGTVMAAIIFGFSQVLTVVYLSSHFTMVMVFALLIFVLIIKPSGLMGKQKEFEERV